MTREQNTLKPLKSKNNTGKTYPKTQLNMKTIWITGGDLKGFLDVLTLTHLGRLSPDSRPPLQVMKQLASNVPYRNLYAVKAESH